MSFILEALRKSEHERQRLGNASIADLPIGRRQHGQPWWVLALAALLLINLIVLMVVLLRAPASKSPSSNNAAVANSATPSSSQPSPQPSSSSPTATSPPSTPSINSQPALTAPPPAAASSALQSAAQAPQIQYERVPRTEMEIASAASVPPDGPALVRSTSTPRPATTNEVDAPADLRLDLHVYSQNRNERFVMINMRRYSEGQQLPTGAIVEQITPDGVVLQQDGARFRISR